MKKGRGKAGKLILSVLIAVTMTFTPVFGSFANNAFALDEKGTVVEEAAINQTEEAVKTGETVEADDSAVDSTTQPSDEDITKDAEGAALKAKAPRKAAGANGAKAYTVEFNFGDAEQSDFSDYSIYASVQKENQDGKEVTYYSSKAISDLKPSGDLASVEFASFTRSNDKPGSVDYTDVDKVNIALVKNLNVEQNGDERGSITGGTVVGDRDVAGGFIVTVTSEADKTVYTFSKPDPYKYNVRESKGEAISFDSDYTDNWYLLSTLEKSGGDVFYKVSPVGLNGESSVPKTGTNEIETFYTADSNNIANIKIGNESGNIQSWMNITTSIYQTGDTVTNELVHVSSTAEDYKQIVTGGESFGDGDVANKYIISSKSESGQGTITLTKVPDFKIKTAFKDAENNPIEDTTSLPKDYKLLIKMIRGGETFYALHAVDSSSNPSGESDSIKFFKYTLVNGNGEIGSTPYYYSGNGSETISTQVVTGAESLNAQLIQNNTNAVFYNENTVGKTQNSDLTKDLFSSSSEIKDNVMTTTFVKQKDDGVDHDINVSFYKEHTDDIDKAELNPDKDNMYSDNDNAYFFRVRLYNNGKLVAYKIVPVTKKEAEEANSTGKFTHTIKGEETFQLVDDKGVNIEGGELHYDPTVYTSDVRLYKTINVGDSLPANLSEVSSKGSDTLEGYDFWQNVFNEIKDGDSITKTETNLALYKAYNKKYQVQIVIDDESVPSSGDAICLLVEAAHQTTKVDKYENDDISKSENYREQKTVDGKTIITYLIEDQTGDSPAYNWTEHGEDSNKITGNEKFNLTLKQGGISLAEGYPVKIGSDYYTVNYDTGNTNGKNVVVDDGSKVTTITHFINLTKATYDNAIGPYDVLGEGAEYGVVADKYVRKEHSETNFAVNAYDEVASAGIDLAANGNKDIPFYVGYYNKIHFTGNVKVNPDIYTPSSKADKYVHNSNDEKTDKIHQDGNNFKITVIPTSEEAVKSYVNGLIKKLKESSAAYKDKPSVKASGRTVDTTMFPDKATIYIDATDLNISNAGWEIKKLEGQSIVLNIPGNTVNIAKEDVSVYKKNADGSLTALEEKLNSNTGGNGGDSVHNIKVENYILNHIVFNAYEASKVNFTDGPAGLFLAPDADVEEIKGSGTGWVATGKTFVQTGSEWHFFRTQRNYDRDSQKFTEAKGEITLIKKGKDDKDLEGATFDFYRIKAGEETEDVKIASGLVTDKSGKITQNNLEPGTYYFVETKAPKGYILPKGDDAKTKSATVEAGKTSLEPLEIEMTNEYDAEGSVTIKGTKTLTGAPMANGQFSFSLELDDESSNAIATALNDADGNVEFPTIKYTFKDLAGGEVKNGKLTKQFIYYIKENHPESAKRNGENWELNGMTYDGHTVKAVVTATDEGDGTISTSVEYSDKEDSFANNYKAGGSIILTANKTLNGKAPEEGQFKFNLKNYAGNIIDTKPNDENGLITFDKIDFDKAGEYTYTIEEVIPEGASDNGDGTFTDGDIIYDGHEVNVKVNVKAHETLDGQLDAVPSYSGGSLTFANKTDKVSAKKFNVKIQKADAVDQYKALNDCEMAVIEWNEETKAEGNEPIAQWTSNAGELKSVSVELGKTYILRELKAPIGYALTKDKKFTVYEENGEVKVEYLDDEGNVRDDGVLLCQDMMLAGNANIALTGTKELKDGDISKYNFEFNVYNKDEYEAYKAGGDKPKAVSTATTKNALPNEDGVVSLNFSDIEYTFDDLKVYDGDGKITEIMPSKTFEYVIVEERPETAADDGFDETSGIQYDTSEETFTATVSYSEAIDGLVDTTDVGLKVESNADDLKLNFTNSYTDEGSDEDSNDDSDSDTDSDTDDSSDTKITDDNSNDDSDGDTDSDTDDSSDTKITDDNSNDDSDSDTDSDTDDSSDTKITDDNSSDDSDSDTDSGTDDSSDTKITDDNSSDDSDSDTDSDTDNSSDTKITDDNSNDDSDGDAGDKTETVTKVDKSAETGDNNLMLICIGLMLMSMLVIALMALRRIVVGRYR